MEKIVNNTDEVALDKGTQVDDINNENKNLSENESEVAINEENDVAYRYLLFELDKEQYGVNIEYVIEIIGIQEITKIPGTPSYVKGLINLRGKIIPLIDGRLKFNKMTQEYNERTCIIVLEVKDIIVGLVVDSISDVVTLYERDLEDSPKVGKIKANKYIKEIAKVNNEVKLLIDCEKFINE